VKITVDAATEADLRAAEKRLRLLAADRFDKFGTSDADGAMLWDVASYLVDQVLRVDPVTNVSQNVP
jgi:hypothetical protein